MKKFAMMMVSAALVLALGGCGWLFGDNGMFRDRGDNYRRATQEKPLQVPAGLDSDSIDKDSVVPKIGYAGALEGEFTVPRPEPLDGNVDEGLVRIQKLNTDSWILVEAAPGEVWPRVRQFLLTNQLTVLRADATAGIIETGWLQPKTAGAPRERYRFRIEQGVQRGTSEVYVLQASAANGDAWPATSANAEREGEMIKALAQFVADNGSSGAVSMLAQRAIDSKGKVFLSKKAGEHPYLRLELPFDRAWASVLVALPKAGFTADDLNRNERQLWVHYEVPKELVEKKGWWRRFWTWVFGDKEASTFEGVKYVLHMDPDASPAGATPGADAAQRLTVERQDGKPLSANTAEQLLNMIKGKLS
jgi:outer membrane protein assembly factor BamC